MPNQLMIAVDETAPSRQAVRYAAEVAACGTRLNFCLIHIQPAVSPIPASKARQARRSPPALPESPAAPATVSESILYRQRETLTALGVPADRIATVSLPDRKGPAQTLLDHGQAKQCDAIVAGRRDLSSLKKPFMGRFTADLVENSTHLPIWIVDGEVASSRLLVAVDGSEGSLRAIDHLAVIFKGNTTVKFHLLHVIPRLVESCPIDFGNARMRLELAGRRGARHCIGSFYDRAIARLAEAGIGTHQIELQIIEKHLNPGKAVLRTACQGNFGTVVIGRRGINRSFFSGSVSRYVINHAENVALWLVS